MNAPDRKKQLIGIKLLEKVLEDYRNSLGKMSSAVVKVYTNLAKCFLLIKDLEKAY
jgi:hypothetical protein